MRPHVVVISLPVQSHLSPFIWIAEYLAEQGIDVTFVHTQSTAARLRSRNGGSGGGAAPEDGASPPDGRCEMRVEVVPDMLGGAPATRDTLLASMPLMHKGLEEVVAGAADVCCIIADNIFQPAHDVAAKYGIPIVDLVTYSAATYCIGLYAPQLAQRGYVLPVTPESAEGKKRVDFIPGMPPTLVLDDIPLILITDKFEGEMFQLFCSGGMGAEKADRVLINSFYELEANVINALREHKPNIQVEMIGPMMANSVSNVAARSLLPEDETCMGWLDMQPEASVVYVSFGSMVTLDAHATYELALGLDASEQRFLWVLRSDPLSNGNTTTSMTRSFPPSLVAKLSTGYGLIISWAPQLAVLAHRSVGAFITHCGWNSTLESISFGVPMIGIPQAAEQNTNLKFIVDVWKVGVPLSNNINKGTFDHACVEASVKAMICGQEGREARARALDLKHKAQECMLPHHGTSKLALENLVSDLKRSKLRKPYSLP